MARKENNSRQLLTTSQQLGSLVKSARDIMRKDKGLNGDLDRLPMLTWILFLKFLDDHEAIREEEATLRGSLYRSTIEQPYRWRDWAAKENGITGDELIAFINNDEAIRPDGSRGAGLFAYLRSLQGERGRDRQDVIATVFKGTVNRMISGYLLRDVLNRVNRIHFDSSDEIHTLSHLYESMLKEMRDAAGDSGEFYTPRAVVRLMVQVVNPRLGETLLDPACGTGGFLVEAYTHMEAQCQTVEDRRILQQQSLYGGEAKSLPYLLAQMNLLLHGLDAPQIAYGNSLEKPLKEIGDKDRVDIILTNPPFGGEEEKGIQGNFDEHPTSETALLFLQLIMRKLRRAPLPGRAAVVVPNGVLFGDGVCASIKEQMLKSFNVHTIVRLPNGVFEPYTSIPTNLIFFDRSGPTQTIWYYEHPLPEGRRSYTKTKPLQFEEFTPLLDWWSNRNENTLAWKFDFRTTYDQALAAAQPLWDQASEKKSEAGACSRRIKEVNEEIVELEKTLTGKGTGQTQNHDQIEILKKRRRELQIQETQLLQQAREAQTQGDKLYWPIYNLDHKNPHSQEELAHLPPLQIADSILQKEQRIAEIMMEIKQILERA